MKNQKSKALPEKINRYLIFGHWLSKELRLTDIKTTNIEDLFNINSSHEEQISFYTKFHNDYKSIKKTMIKQNKMKNKNVEALLQDLVNLPDNEIKSPDINADNDADNDADMDFLWD